MVHPWRIAVENSAVADDDLFLDENPVAHGGLDQGLIQNGRILPDDDGTPSSTWGDFPLKGMRFVFVASFPITFLPYLRGLA
jgi:hypothetical protein